jgi:hypothetical protein
VEDFMTCRHVWLCLLFAAGTIACSSDEKRVSEDLVASHSTTSNVVRAKADPEGGIGGQTAQTPPPSAKQAPARPVPSDPAAIQEFNDRIAAYAKLRKKVENDVPDLNETKDATKIVAHREALAVGLRLARKDARQGDLFTPAAARQVRRFIDADFDRRSDAAADAVLEEVPEKGRIRVNEPYPEGAPLATMPPDILARLPVLPDEVEYRFLGRHLILRDVGANLILDFVYNVLPADGT